MRLWRVALVIGLAACATKHPAEPARAISLEHERQLGELVRRMRSDSFFSYTDASALGARLIKERGIAPRALGESGDGMLVDLGSGPRPIVFWAGPGEYAWWTLHAEPPKHVAERAATLVSMRARVRLDVDERR